MTIWDHIAVEKGALETMRKALRQSAYRKASQLGRPSKQQVASLRLLDAIETAQRKAKTRQGRRVLA